MPVPPSETVAHEASSQQLRRLIDGLLFISETEAPLQVVQLSAASAADVAAAVRAAAHVSADALVREQPLDDVLEERSNPPEGAGPTDIRQAPAYAALLKWLQTHVSEARAFRVGVEAPQELFLIGKAADGSWIGVRTTTVDT